jgi:hypothetical protein
VKSCAAIHSPQTKPQDKTFDYSKYLIVVGFAVDRMTQHDST